MHRYNPRKLLIKIRNPRKPHAEAQELARVRGNRLLRRDGLATEHPVAAVPVAAEPDPVLDPAAAVPVDEGNVLGVIGVPPVREDEDDFAPQRDGDLTMVREEMLALLHAEMRLHLLGPIDF